MRVEISKAPIKNSNLRYNECTFFGRTSRDCNTQERSLTKHVIKNRWMYSSNLTLDPTEDVAERIATYLDFFAFVDNIKLLSPFDTLIPRLKEDLTYENLLAQHTCQIYLRPRKHLLRKLAAEACAKPYALSLPYGGSARKSVQGKKGAGVQPSFEFKFKKEKAEIEGFVSGPLAARKRMSKEMAK